MHEERHLAWVWQVKIVRVLPYAMLLMVACGGSEPEPVLAPMDQERLDCEERCAPTPCQDREGDGAWECDWPCSYFRERGPECAEVG